MSQIHGKQIRATSVDLEKLSGTGSVTFNSGASMAFPSGATLTTATNNINNLTDVVNKEYVDSIASGLDVKEAARLLSDTNITGTYANGTSGVGATITTSVTTLNIDSIAVANGDRVVLKGQTNTAHNGIYVVSGVGTAVVFTRSTDFDGTPSSEINGGEFVFIKEGTLWADTGFVVSIPNDTITVGSDPIIFTQFSAAGVVTPGAGLVAGTGTDFDVNTGIGLTISSDAVRLANTAVSPGSYGASGTVSTFTVDQQGRLTLAGDVAISITHLQVSDFDTAVNGEVFASSNFIDSSSVDFTVTPGATVSADVKVNTGTGLTVGSSGVEINYGTGLTVSGNQLVVDASTFGVQGATNGLSIDSNSDVILGGTLSQNTNIDGGAATNNLTFTNMGQFTVDSVAEPIRLSSQGDNVQLNGETITLFDTAGTTITSQSLNINATSSVYTDLNIGSETGIRYAGSTPLDYVTDPYSLTTKGYVDAGTASLWTAIQNNEYFADTTKGLNLSGNTFSVVLDSDALQFTGGAIDLKDTIDGDRTFADSVTVNGNLTVNGTVSYIYTQDLMVEDNIITLNATYSGAGGPIDYTGIEVNVDGTDFSKLLWESSTGTWVAGLSGSETELIQFAGTGLTRTGATLSINTAGFSSALAGVGLTANGATIDVRATNGLTVSVTSDSVELGAPLTRETVINGINSHRFAVVGTTGMTFSARNGNISTEVTDGDVTTQVTNGDVTTQVIGGGVLLNAQAFVDVNSDTNIGITASGDLNIASINAIYTDTDATKTGIRYAGSTPLDYVTDPYSLTTKGYVDAQITTNTYTAGIGLTVSGNEFSILWGGTASGLTYSGANDVFGVAVDNNSIIINNSGQLQAVGTGATPVYDFDDTPSAAVGANGAGAATGVTLTQTPSDYSRIEVYVNGQRQRLGETTTVDCWFGTSTTAKALNALVQTDELYWNAQSAGFRIDTDDRIEIIYEK